MRASLSRHGIDVGGDAGEDEDDGARKLRVLPLLESRSRLTSKLHAEQMNLEAEITRRHFHVRPQAPSELAHWERYLSWAEKQVEICPRYCPRSDPRCAALAGW